jgi:hypothetical protein
MARRADTMSTSTTNMEECEPDTGHGVVLNDAMGRPQQLGIAAQPAGDPEAGRWLGRQAERWIADAARGDPVLPLQCYARASYGARVAAVRNAFLQMPARLAAELAREEDAAKVRAVLDDEIRRVLTFFAEGVQHDAAGR